MFIWNADLTGCLVFYMATLLPFPVHHKVWQVITTTNPSGLIGTEGFPGTQNFQYRNQESSKQTGQAGHPTLSYLVE